MEEKKLEIIKDLAKTGFKIKHSGYKNVLFSFINTIIIATSEEEVLDLQKRAERIVSSWL